LSSETASYLGVRVRNRTSRDVALGVTIPARDARSKIARLGPVVNAVLANHTIRR
jgi:hypothetical protein